MGEIVNAGWNKTIVWDVLQEREKLEGYIKFKIGIINLFEQETNNSLYVDFRDEQKYKTVKIGKQIWMAENINIGTMINGKHKQTNNGVIEKYCYNDNPANCKKHGGLYQWKEVMQYTKEEGVQGICPSGWHIPSDYEWKILEMYLGMIQSEADDWGWRSTDEGKKMKSTSGWYNNGNGTNSSGFNGLPGGGRYSYGLFYDLGYNGLWWSCTEHSGTNAWRRYLGYDRGQVSRGFSHKARGFSVRCLKD